MRILDGVECERAWLLTWNSTLWSWEDYIEKSKTTKKDHPFIRSWACWSKKPKIGDEVFLVRLGENPKGLIGHGIVLRESYSKDHYLPEKAAEGKKVNAIDVRFDRLLDFEAGEFISLEVLKDKCEAQFWTPQNSGISIKAEVLPALHILWTSYQQ